jgi:hypothetical protein
VLELLPPPPVGIHCGIPDRTYHRFDCLSRSLLEAYHSGDSLAQIRYGMLHETLPTPQMILGTAVHMAVVEPERFAVEVVPAPDDLNLHKPSDRTRLAEFLLEHSEHLVLSGEEKGISRWDACRYMADAVRAHPFGRAFLPLISHRELTLVWQHPQTRTVARCRLDALAESVRALIDVKSIYSTNRTVRQKRIDAGYGRQGAFYQHVAKALGLPVDHVIVYFVKSAPPWEVVPVRLTELSLGIGWNEMEAAWLKADPQVAAGCWPGHTDDVEEMGLSEWRERKALYDGMM